MTTESIIESGMTFGPYAEGHCFYIEKDETIQKINKHAKKGEGVQVAEFLLLETKDDQVKIFIVEAKTTSPRPENSNRYIDEIKQKLANSLALFAALYLQRHSATNSELSDHFRHLELAKVKFVLILVIKNSKEEWLIPVQDALQKALKSTVKIWNLAPTSVVVLNEDGARKHGLMR